VACSLLYPNFFPDDLVDPSRIQSFSYNAPYRLIAALGIYSAISYGYDHAGARLTKSAST